MKRRILRLLWGPALLLLAVVLVIANMPEKEQLPAGAGEGQRVPAFRAVCTDGSTFDLREQKGKTIVINLWATWCAPCVKELPNFERLQKERPEDVAVLALHSPPVTTDVEKWLSGFGCDIPFAVDADGSLSAALNASDVLPQTVIIGPDGVVAYNRSGTLSYGQLASLTDGAAKQK